MRLRAIVTSSFVLLVAVVAVGYIRISLRQAAEPPKPARSPDLDRAPVRLYGILEPAGREAFVGPIQARRVVAVLVAEGDRVEADQALCELDSDVEVRALRVAESKLEESLRRLELTRDDLRRKRTLVETNIVSEFDLSQIELQAQLEEAQVATARAEVELRRTELEKLTLRSPLAGVVYKFDVRVGELLTPQDYQRIVVGSEKKQARLFIESFWLGRLSVGERFRVRHAENLEQLGTGILEALSPYVGTRDFRTEDRLERLDTKFAQGIVRLDGALSAPIGLLVLCERVPDHAPP